MSSFSERLKELRHEENLSQDELARRVGITHTAIGLWELNKREPKLLAVIALSKYFNVSLGYMAGVED